MKKLLTVLTASLTLFTGQAMADGYFQPQLGLSKMNSVTFAGASSEGYGSASGNVEFDDDVIFGLEVGMSNFEQYNVLRWGVSWMMISGDVSSVYTEVSGGDDLDPGAYSLSGGEARANGMDFQSDINLYSANLYYDFPSSSSFKPYVGFGLGIADLQNTDNNETAVRFILGANLDLEQLADSNMQLGFKYDYIKMKDITHNTGASVDHGKVHALSATLNFKF